MIAKPRPSTTKLQAGFLRLLPNIQKQARFAFRHLRSDNRDDAIEEVIANAYVAYVNLVKHGRGDDIYASALARFAIRQYHAGRRVGNRLSGRDVLSEYARKKLEFVVERLDQYSDHAGTWREILIEDRSVTPAELACSRLDVARWLQMLAPRDRRLAETLAMGESTGKAAKKFRISPGRISQIRRQLCSDWRAFQRQLLVGVAAA
jgi:hypothetical protein